LDTVVDASVGTVVSRLVKPLQLSVVQHDVVIIVPEKLPELGKHDDTHPLVDKVNVVYLTNINPLELNIFSRLPL
jgi:hypothetical protein